jgi:hypothetical protein
MAAWNFIPPLQLHPENRLHCTQILWIDKVSHTLCCTDLYCYLRIVHVQIVYCWESAQWNICPDQTPSGCHQRGYKPYKNFFELPFQLIRISAMKIEIIRVGTQYILKSYGGIFSISALMYSARQTLLFSVQLNMAWPQRLTITYCKVHAVQMVWSRDRSTLVKTRIHAGTNL